MSNISGAECSCSDSAQEYGLTDPGCPRHDPEIVAAEAEIASALRSLADLDAQVREAEIWLLSRKEKARRVWSELHGQGQDIA